MTTVEDPELCAACGEPYVRQWTRIDGVSRVTVNDGHAVVDTPELGITAVRMAPVDDHHPCPAREQP